MSTSGVSGSGSSTTSSTSSSVSGMGNVSLNDFIQMLVSELDNQDPTQPMQSSEILQQVSQIESISSTQQLSTTMNSVILGQNMASATGLLNQQISGTDQSSNPVNGIVNSVSVGNGTVTLQVGNQTVPLNNVTGIVAPTSGNLGGLSQYFTGNGT